MPSCNECLILLRSEESPWKNYSSLQFALFDEEGLMISAAKSNIVQELENGKRPKELPSSCMKTGYVVDVMVNVCKIKTYYLEAFREFCDSLMNFVQHTSKGAFRIDFVFDAYLERSIKDSERQKREKKLPIELLEIERKTPLPVEMDRFWQSSRNKANLETLIHRTALCNTWNRSVIEVLVSSFDISVEVAFCPTSGLVNQ